MSRPKLGEGSRALLRRTGAAALEQVSGAPPETAKKPPATAVPELPEARGEYVVVTYRLRPEHVTWLARRALERKTSRGARGRADASEVLREVLDQRIRDEH